MFIDHYRLERNPFTADRVRSVFHSHSYRHAAARIGQVLQNRIHCLYLSGAARVGKSTLVAQELSGARGVNIATVPSGTQDPRAMLAGLVNKLGPGQVEGSTSELRQILGVFLQHQFVNGRRSLRTGERYSPFVRDLASSFDLTELRVRELCDQIDAPSAWEAGPLPGISVMHFAGGPRAVAPDTGFVRLPRGLQFPYHRHVGHEINYVLEGALRDGDGSLYLPGEAIVMRPGTEHELSVPNDADALMAVVQAGFEFVPKPGGHSS
jgi:hypothetical protein